MNGTPNKIKRLLPGWWLGENDGRPHEPYISPNRWDEELRGAWFCGADAIVYDEPAPFQTSAHIVARPTPKPIKNHGVTLLTDSNCDCDSSTLPMSSPGNRSIWKRDLRMALYWNLQNVDTVDTSGANESLKEFFSSVAADSNMLHDALSAEFLAHKIGVTLFGFMLKPTGDFDVKATLGALGVDSFISIELKNWCRQKLGSEISVLEILNVENLWALGQLAVDGLMAKFGVTRSGEEFFQMKADESTVRYCCGVGQQHWHLHCWAIRSKIEYKCFSFVSIE